MLTSVGGVRFDKKNANRVCIAHVVSVVPKPTFILFFLSLLHRINGFGVSFRDRDRVRG